MTRKDYILIAEVLKNFPTYAEQPTDDRNAMAYDFADRLASENPRFDRTRFLIAAGVLNEVAMNKALKLKKQLEEAN